MFVMCYNDNLFVSDTQSSEFSWSVSVKMKLFEQCPVLSVVISKMMISCCHMLLFLLLVLSMKTVCGVLVMVNIS